MGIRPMFRATKDQAQQLFRLVTNVDITLNPWSNYKMASTKEFWRAVSVPSLKKVNPKCIINVDTHNRNLPPSIQIKYLDGSQQKFVPAEMDVVEIWSDIHQHAYVINADLEDQGKSLDDVG